MLLARPNIASKEWVYRQYDHQVQAATVVLPGGDAAVVRIGDGPKGIALSAGCNSRFCELDPFEGARLAVAEVCRNLAVVGAEPIGLTDCLNFGNPEKPEIMWQLVKAIHGLSDVCRALDVPIVSGNVSLYNETDGQAIQPTPAVAAVGLISDVRAAVRSWFLREGDSIALLGTNTGELGGSELLAALGNRKTGRPPRLNPTRERAVQAACRALIQARLLHSAHDCSDGGLAVALAESCVMGPRALGAHVQLPSATERPDLDVFSEEPSRIVISFSPDLAAAVRTLVRTFGAAFTQLGTVGGAALKLEGLGTVPVDAIASAYHGGFTAALGLTA